MTKEEILAKIAELEAQHSVETVSATKAAITRQINQLRVDLDNLPVEDDVPTADATVADATTADVSTVDAPVTNAIPQTYEEVIKAMTSDNNNKVVYATIVSCQLNNQKAKSGIDYWQIVLTLNTSVPASVKQVDGTHRIGTTSTLIMPYWNIELAMRHSEFYGAYVEAVGNMVEAGMANTYLSGMQIKLLAEFVPAGVEKNNPFRRNALSYGVQEYDRFIHHVISVETPTNPIHINRYGKIDEAITAMAIERMKAAATARNNRAAILAAATVTADDVPF